MARLLPGAALAEPPSATGRRPVEVAVERHQVQSRSRKVGYSAIRALSGKEGVELVAGFTLPAAELTEHIGGGSLDSSTGYHGAQFYGQPLVDLHAYRMRRVTPKGLDGLLERLRLLTHKS